MSRLPVGGTERQLAMLALGLKRAGHEVQVAVLWGRGAIADELCAEGIPVEDFGFPRAAAGEAGWPVQTFRCCLRYARWLRALDPDVHHSFLISAYVLTTPLSRVACRALRVQGRRNLHEVLIDYRVPRPGRLARARVPATLLAEALAVRVTDHLVANSLAVLEDTVAHEHLPPARISLIHNGVEAAFFGIADPPGSAVLHVVCVANLHPYKGHAHLLQAVRRLADEGESFDVALAGSGEARVELEAYVRAHHLPVHFLGQRLDVPAVLGEADIVVHPSLTEGFSNSVLEAMAAGRPLVATDAGGTREALGNTGILVPVADAAAIHGALRRLLHDGPERARLGQLARRRAQERFSADAMVRRHLALYGRLLAERRTASPARVLPMARPPVRGRRDVPG